MTDRPPRTAEPLPEPLEGTWPPAEAGGEAIVPPISGLDAFRRALTDGGPGLPVMQGRMLLDALGLGIEQTYRYLGQTRADLATFRQWILATVGPPDASRLARYEAAIAGDAPPEDVKDRLAAIDAAPVALDADDLAGWEEDGYVVLRGAIGRNEAEAVAQLVWDDLGACPDAPDSWYGHTTLQGLWMARFQHPAMEVARRSARIHKAFAQLWGTADLWMTIDRLSFNPPERPGHPFQGSPLHWDVSLARPIPFAAQAILYLTDTAGDQGALRVVPGFHRRMDAWLDGLGDSQPRSIDLGDQATTIAGAAGDLVIWRQDLPHGASPNTAARPRLAQYVTMYPAWLRQHRDWV